MGPRIVFVAAGLVLQRYLPDLGRPPRYFSIFFLPMARAEKNSGVAAVSGAGLPRPPDSIDRVIYIYSMSIYLYGHGLFDLWYLLLFGSTPAARKVCDFSDLQM